MMERKNNWKNLEKKGRGLLFLLALAVFMAGFVTVGPNMRQAAARDEFVVTNGVLTEYAGNGGTVVVPAGVTAIGNRAFAGKGSITSVVLPEGLETIGDNAFDCCFGMEEVIFPSTLKEIGSYAFAMCTALEEVRLPEALETIGEGAFIDCKSLWHIQLPSRLKVIPAQMLSGCEALQSLTVPAGVESIGTGAFERCLPGKTQVASGNSHYKVENDCLMTQDGKQLLLLADSNASVVILPAGTRQIHSYAFYGAPGLTQIIGNQGLEEIGAYAFYRCEKLQTVKLPGSITHIGTGAFGLDKNLSDFALDVTCSAYRYRDHMLMDTKENSLAAVFGKNMKIEVPAGIVSIEDFAFSAGEKITAVLPASLAHISDSLAYLQNCVKIELSGNNPYFAVSGGFLWEMAKGRILAVADQNQAILVMPEGVRELTAELSGANVRKLVLSSDFYSHLDLDKLLKDFPQLEDIDTAANPRFDFQDGVLIRYLNGEKIACYYIESSAIVRLPQGITGGCAALPAGTRVLVLPDSVHEIRSASFRGEGLVKVVLGNQVSRIEDNAFSSRTVLYVTPDSQGEAYAKDGGYIYRLYEAGTDVSWLPGDCNSDERISSADVICLMQVLAEMEVHGFDRRAAEVSGNGKIGSEDAVLLMQYLAEYDVILR